MTLRLSIAMTTYNGADYLPEQLRSFAEQSRLPDQLIACDDDSTDATMAILEQFAATAPFAVKLVRNPVNLGHERNFGQAIDRCDGDIILLADQDDRWNPDKLARIAAEFERDPAALLVVNDVMITDQQLVPTGRTVLGQTRAAGVLGRDSKSLTLGCATAFRSSFRALVSPVPALDYGHDSWIHDFADMVGGRKVVDDVLQLYRRHDENVSNWAFNGSAKASPKVVMQPSAGSDLTGAYDKRVTALKLMRERVEGLGPDRFAALRTGRDFKHVLAGFDHAIAAVERRKRVFRKGRLGKVALATQMLVAGDYHYFLGLRSFVKDLIR